MWIDTGRTQVTVSKQQLGAGSGKLTREQSKSKAASGKNLTVHLKASTIHSETFPNGALPRQYQDGLHYAVLEVKKVTAGTSI